VFTEADSNGVVVAFFAQTGIWELAILSWSM
jgi:hypothetical protein